MLLNKENNTIRIEFAIVGIVLSFLLTLLFQINAFKPITNQLATFSNNIRSYSYISLTFFPSFNKYFSNKEIIRNELREQIKNNQELQSEIVLLKESLEDYQAISEQENFKQNYEQLPVRIIGRSDQEYGIYFVNKGNEDGIIVGDIIVMDQFALGEVIEVNEKSAKFISIQSPNSIIPAVSLENKTKGLLIGDIEKGLLLNEIQVDKHLEVDELVVTTGINSNFPYGLILGNIEMINYNESEPVKSALINSNIDIDSIEKAFVVLSSRSR